MGQKLLCPGGDEEIRIGGFRRHGAGGTCALQHSRGGQEVWGGVEENQDCNYSHLWIIDLD